MLHCAPRFVSVISFLPVRPDCLGVATTWSRYSRPPLGDKMRALDQHRRGGPEWRERALGFVNQFCQPFFGAGKAEHAGKCCFPRGAVLAGRFADQSRIAFAVQQIIGDLNRFAARRAIAREPPGPRRAGAAENAAGLASEAKERAGLHRLKEPYLVGAMTDRTEAALGGEIEHLAAGHAADAGGARQGADKFDPHGGIRMGVLAREYIESKSQKPVAGENRRPFVEFTVRGRLSAP